jgi:hypothetical protein
LEKSNIELKKSNDDLKIINNEILQKLNNIQVKNKSVTGFGDINKNFGDRVQKINPETKKLVKYFESISEILKENPLIARGTITKAIANNSICEGFRWMNVDRNLDANIIINYQETKDTKSQSKGYIAKLNKDKTQILNVHLDRKVASLKNGYESHSALDIPVKIKKKQDDFIIVYMTIVIKN